MKKKLLRTFLILTALCIIALTVCIGISAHVVKSTQHKITDTADGFDADCIIVLGAKVRDGQPSLMLRDRLDRAIEIHFNTGTPLLMSGDCSSDDYDEVSVMKSYAMECGVKEESIYTDPEGYSTLESVVRLEIFGFDEAIVVTQRYHLSRALYLCEQADVDAIGIPAEDISYYGEAYRLIREIVARNKDFFFSLFI